MADTPTPVTIPIQATGEQQAVQSLGRVQNRLTQFGAGVQAVAQRTQTALSGMSAAFAGFAALFSAAFLQKSLSAWRETSVSMRELEAALGRAGDATGEFAAQLNALADTQETLTGISDAHVRSVMRVLSSQGLAADQIGKLTPLVLDLGVAMGMDAVTAARQLGAQMDEGVIRLRKYNIEARSAEELTAQLTRAVGGQAAASFAAHGSAGQLAVAFGNLKEEIGRLAEGPLFAFLNGMVAGVQRAVTSMEAWRRANQETYDSIVRTFGAAGDVIGRNLDSIILLGGGYFALTRTVRVLQGAVMAGTGMALIPFGKAVASNLAGVQGLSAQFGLLQAATVGVWGAMVSLGAAIVTAVAAWKVGSWLKDVEILGDTIENRLIRQLLRLQVIWIEFRQRLFGGSPELQQQADEIRAEIERTSKVQQDAEKARDAAIDERMAKEAAAEAVAGSSPSGRFGTARGPNAALIAAQGQRAVEEEQLARGRAVLEADLEERRVTLNQFEAWKREQVNRTYELEVEKLRQTAAEADDQQKAQLELEQALRLAHEKHLTDLWEMEQDLAKKRDALRAEELRKSIQADEERLNARRGDIVAERERVQRSFRVGREEKRRQEIASLREEGGVVDESIRGMQTRRDMETDPAARAQMDDSIRGMKSERRGIGGKLASAEETPDPNSIADQFDATITKAEDRLNTFAEGVADVFGSVIQGAVDGIAQSIEGLLKGTMDWGDALRNIGSSILNSVISAIAKMFAEWMVKRMLMLVFNKTASTQEGATDAAAKAPGAMMASISSYGVAAIIGLAAMMAALAAIGGGFESGGYTGSGGTKQPAGVVHGKEFVLNAGAVGKYGLPLLMGMNAQAAKVWEAGQPSTTQARGMMASSPASAADSGARRTLNVVMVDDRNQARDYLKSAEGEAAILNIVKRRQTAVGIPS